MTGDKEPKPSQDQHPRAWPDDDNPFVAFRRYADEQISSMLQSVMGLPSIVSSPPPDHWAIFEDPKYQRAKFRQTPDGDERPAVSGKDRDDNPDSSTRSPWPEPDDRRQTQRSVRNNYSSSDLFDIDLFFDSFFDRFWFDDRFSHRFFHPYHRPMFSSMVNDESPAWPVYYLMFSPYSPLHLERQAHYRSNRDRGVFSSIMSSLRPSSERDPAEPQWREAFEDLLRLENGKPMLDRDSTDLTKKETGRDWLQGLAKRGSLGDRWKYVSGTEGKPWSTITYDTSRKGDADGNSTGENVKAEFSWNEDDHDSVTELDLYDRFLSDIEAREREVFRGVYESPLLRLIFDDRRRARDESEPSLKESPNDYTDSWASQVTADQRQSSQEPSVDSTMSAVAETEHKPYVMSTSTSTERIRLEDGSVQTKTIKTKRFSDGREESNESVEVVNPRQNKSASGEQDGSVSNPNKSGWFWKEN
ncbi:hypothetical protein BDV59DRAFT_175625 [Aspergillus ambiguus]|uniref:uncharacterized protein n=1 Tax=Aspergillus ambiguus TaxID=176160 RepID=UPI003CCCCFF8